MLIDLTKEEMDEVISAVRYSTQYYPSDEAFDAVVKMEKALGVMHTKDNDCICDTNNLCRVCKADHNVNSCWKCGIRVYRNPNRCIGCAGQSKEEWSLTDMGKAHNDYINGKINAKEYVKFKMREDEEISKFLNSKEKLVPPEAGRM